MAITIDGLTVDMPKEWAPTLMKQAFEESAVGQLSRSEPMPLDGKTIPVYEGGFEVGYVPEGTPKPVSDVSLTFQGIVPKKFAGIVLVSKEAARRNPARMLDLLQADMRNGVKRQIDYAVLYGKSARTGTAIAETTSVNATTSRVELAAGDLVPQFLSAYDLAAAGSSDPNGWAFDSRFRTRVSLASQQELAPAGGISPMPNLANVSSTFGGLPATYSRVVSGRVGTQVDTNVKGFVGDWDKVHWGFSEDISLQRSTEATVVDGAGKTWHLFQDNMIAYLVEFEIGWYVDATAFAAIEDKVA